MPALLFTEAIQIPIFGPASAVLVILIIVFIVLRIFFW